MKFIYLSPGLARENINNDFPIMDRDESNSSYEQRVVVFDKIVDGLEILPVDPLPDCEIGETFEGEIQKQVKDVRGWVYCSDLMYDRFTWGDRRRIIVPSKEVAGGGEKQASEDANGYGVYAKGSEKFNAFNEGFYEGAKWQRKQPSAGNEAVELSDTGTECQCERYREALEEVQTLCIENETSPELVGRIEKIVNNSINKP